jgi:hypothetical protein
VPGGDSLAKLLVQARDVRSRRYLPDLTEEAILTWADRHHAETGDWPIDQSGDAPGEKGDDWHNIDAALRQRLRGLPGGSSLARLLQRHARRPIGSPWIGWRSF